MHIPIDWHSVGLSCTSTVLALITGNAILVGLSTLGIVTTIVLNVIKIVKELKK